jgi:hypothetical protein
MKIAANYRRTATAVSLALTALLSVLWTVLEPPFGDTTIAQLEILNGAGATATISLSAFIVAQLFFIVSFVGVAHLLRDRAPILSNIAGTIGVIGGFGHAVVGGVQVVQLGMAQDPSNYEAYGALIDVGMPLPGLILMLAGTVGTVLGIVFLGVGIFRSRVAPRWVAYALWAFVLVEFVGTGFTEWASLVSGLLYLGAFGALAVAVWRSPIAVWQTASAAILEPERVQTPSPAV